MENNDLLIPSVLGGIFLAISVYGLVIAKDRKYALGGLFLFSLLPIGHRTMLLISNPEDIFSFVCIVIFLCQAIIAIPIGGFLNANESIQKTWSLKVQLTILVINASFAFLVLSDPLLPNILGIYHAVYAFMMVVAISKLLAGKMDLK